MVRAAVIQMVSGADVDANLAEAERLLGAAARDGAKLAALPEFFPLIAEDDRAKLAIREPFGTGPIQAFLSAAAKRHGLWLIGGTIPIDSGDPEHVYNACLLFDDRGACVARYDKIHLFDVKIDAAGAEQYRESATLRAGAAVVTAGTPFGKVGLSVCYDLRFPELYRKLLEEDVEMISAPSAFTATTGRVHWEMLLRARAVENLCYVIAPAQGGRHNARRTTWGHSMIVDPWGEVLCSVESGPGYACADLDFEKLRGLRRTFPALSHRRIGMARA
jgi:nitrilase